MTALAASPPLLCRVLRECRAEIVERGAHSFISRHPELYARRLREHYDSAAFFAHDADRLIDYLSAENDRDRGQALGQLRACRRELGHRCAAEGEVAPADLTGPPRVTELTAQLLLERYAATAPASAIVEALTIIHTLAVDMTTALLNGYLEYKEGVLAEQGRTVSRLLDELTRVEGNERRSLALELHDGLAQRLVALSSGIQHGARLVEVDPVATRQELDRLGRVARGMIRDLRALIRDLHMGVTAQGGGLHRLADYLADLSEETGIVHDYQIDDQIVLPPAQEAQVLRIIQEALNNAYKHASATRIEVRVAAQAGEVIVSVRDDGRGFDVEAARLPAQRPTHFGLSGMEERAQFLGAQLLVESAPGAGTLVQARVRPEAWRD